MKNNLTSHAWGMDGDFFLAKTIDLLGSHAQVGAYAGDNMIAFSRNLGFLRNEKFISAFSDVVSKDNYIGYGILWRLFIFCWAAKNGLRREGDFVECGVAQGTNSQIMCRYLNFGETSKTLFLYDAWDDTKPNPYGINTDTLTNLQKAFSPWQNVRLVKGYLPNTITDTPDQISFLHIDLNDANAEIAVLEKLFDRVTPGGVILFDDYGFDGFSESQLAEDEWMASRGYQIAELPTGQGLLIK